MCRLTRLLLLFSTLLFLASCKKTDPVYKPAIQPTQPDPITATLQGTVLNENGQPAAGVTIRVGAKSATTDSHGSFRILAAPVDRHQALVTAEKNGYFKAYRSFAATSGANVVFIKLTRRALAGTISAAAGGEASLSNGSKVSLPANGVVDAATGAAYTGSVSVYAAYIDPSAQDISQTIPGSLMADDKDGSRVALRSYGMLAVELAGSAGQKLQIKSGHTATLTTAIPAAGLATAPATIPLWYLDEASGIWKEQGTATKVGSTYVGTVSHFSFWNCDLGMPAVYISMTLQNQAGQPLVATFVSLGQTSASGWTYGAGGVTDSLGQVSGLVPAGEQLSLTVYDPCLGAVYTQSIGPFAQATSLPPITVTVSPAQLLTVSGDLTDCNNAPVTNGYAIVTVNGMDRYIHVNATGHFRADFVRCAGGFGSVEIQGVDAAAQVQSPVTPVSPTGSTANAGTIVVCGSAVTTEFINYSVDGGAMVMLNAADSLRFNSGFVPGTTDVGTNISGSSNSTTANGIYFYLTHAPVPGTYAVSNFWLGQQTSASAVIMVITEWPAATGDFVRATFSGTYMSGNTSHTVTGSLRLRRNF